MSVTKSYTVSGMTCDHCVLSVREEVEEIPGVQTTEVVLKDGSLTITSADAIDDAAVRTAVQEAGYELA